MQLIDTCIWIDFLRGNKSKGVTLLEGLLDSGDIYICDIVFAEICFGATNSKIFKKYSDYFSAIPSLPLPKLWRNQAAQLGFTLRTNGYKPYLADILIALVALEHRVPLVTRDRDFEPFQKLFGLELEILI